MPSRCDTSYTLLTTIFDRFSTRLLILLAGWTKTASLIPIPSGKDSAKTLRETKWWDLMVWDQSFSMLQNVSYERDNFLACFLVSVPFPMSILDSFGCLLGLISFRMAWICMDISLTFQLCFEVIEAPGQDPRTLCALWSGTGEEDHNKKTTGTHHRTTIFLQVLSDRAFHSRWPMFFFHFHSENSNCSCVSQFPWVTVKLEFFLWWIPSLHPPLLPERGNQEAVRDPDSRSNSHWE